MMAPKTAEEGTTLKFTHEVAFRWYKFTSWTLWNCSQYPQNLHCVETHKLLNNHQRGGLHSVPYR